MNANESNLYCGFFPPALFFFTDRLHVMLFHTLPFEAQIDKKLHV